MRKGEISWFTPPVGAGVGFGYAAVKTIEAMQARAVSVKYSDAEPLVFVNFVQPYLYQGLVEQYRVGYSPWESTEVPESWRQFTQQQDELWTTSTFCKEIFEAYDLHDDITIVPHGIDPELWKINDRYVADVFYFLHVGGPTARKGGQRVVDAFLDLYDGRDDVRLLMKSNGKSETRYYDKRGNFLPASRHPQIQIFDSNMSEESLVQLYHKAHCLVYPTNGEGFGLIPFQGIATGMPTICTDLTACTDFASLSMPLKATWGAGTGIHLGDWAHPDEDHLRELMTLAVDDYEAVKNKTLKSARVIHNTQTWLHIGDQILDILGDKIYNKV